MGFLFLTILPGMLILQVLNINIIDTIEKLVLSVGLSVSFLLFFGLLVNNLALSFGYPNPLATIPLLISLDVVLIILATMGYKISKKPFFNMSNLNLTTSEKSFLIVPILFPALSLFGIRMMNTTNNNVILILLLFLIPIYILIIFFLNNRFSDRLYPVVIYLISISLLLMNSLRSNHIIGVDVHSEYYIFQLTLNNLHWMIFEKSLVNSVLSISLLPTIYQSLLNIDPEFLFKTLFSLIYSISPLIVYILSRKYFKEMYAFLASCFFMFSHNFLLTAEYTRASMAIFFLELLILILFDDKINDLQKRILSIVFMASIVLSHYSTAYITFLIIFAMFLGTEILSMKYTFKRIISPTFLSLFFAFIFCWYSYITQVPFDSAIHFIENTIANSHNLFLLDSKGGGTQALVGVGISQKGIPHKMEFILTWLIFVFIGVGTIKLIMSWREIIFSESSPKNMYFLKKKFEVGYSIFAVICIGLLISVVTLPFISDGYSLDRAYGSVSIVLSTFFVMGGITISEIFSKKKLKISMKTLSLKVVDRKNVFQIQAYLTILLVLIPYFFSVTGITYQIFGYPREISLNSNGDQYDTLYVHDQEKNSAKWLERYRNKEYRIYADFVSGNFLQSQGNISRLEINSWYPNSIVLNGYIYLRYNSFVKDKLDYSSQKYNTIEYSSIVSRKNKIYDNRLSEVYMNINDPAFGR
jgi:uncharacterized membrane protein